LFIAHGFADQTFRRVAMIFQYQLFFILVEFVLIIALILAFHFHLIVVFARCLLDDPAIFVEVLSRCYQLTAMVDIGADLVTFLFCPTYVIFF